jgi:hypothetical protein
MQRTEVPDDEALRALPVVEGPENGRSSIRRAKQIRRHGTKMITGKIADRWLKKTTNIIKWIQKKFVSGLCNKFGNPENDDAYEVFGQKFFQNYNSSQWQKYIAPLVLDDGKQQRAGPSQLRMDKPMTSIFLNYAKLRLWVEENLGACYDEDKINEMKAAGHKAAGARRIANWDMVAEKKFLRLEVRIKITKIKDTKSYIIPIFMACIIMFGLILTSYLVLRLKNYEDLEFKDAKTEQPEEEGMVEETKENGDLPVGGLEDPVPLDVNWETEVYPDHADAPDVVDGQLSDTQAAQTHFVFDCSYSKQRWHCCLQRVQHLYCRWLYV